MDNNKPDERRMKTLENKVWRRIYSFVYDVDNWHKIDHKYDPSDRHKNGNYREKDLMKDLRNMGVDKWKEMVHKARQG